MKKIVLLAVMVCAFSVNAAVYEADEPSSWNLISALGWTNFQQMDGASGQTNFLRIALGVNILQWEDKTLGTTHFGLELGGQTGNAMSPDFTQPQLNQMGGVPISATVKPIIDVLVTGSHLLRTFDTPWIYGTRRTWLRGASGVFKAGFAYRQIFFDTTTLPGINRVNGEIQAGINQEINDKTSIGILYQGIYSPKMVLTTTGAQFQATGTVGEIPTQQGIIVLLKMRFS